VLHTVLEQCMSLWLGYLRDTWIQELRTNVVILKMIESDDMVD
jgi:hypothetical protein